MVQNYEGFKEVMLTDEDMAEFYSNMHDNKLGCLTNEYLIIKNIQHEIKDYCKWDGDEYVRVASKQIRNDWLGKVKARNPQQVCAIDMLLDLDITVKALTGKAGSGKSLLMINAAVDLVKKHKFNKIVYIRNNIELAGVSKLGALPGNAYDKLEPFYAGLSDHLGDALMFADIFEFVHLGYMRGRDIRDSIIMVNEAENLTSSHIGLLLSRVAEGSQLWLDGDIKQVDLKMFENDNGLKALDRLYGNKLFATIKLQTCERSDTAKLADLFN